MYKISIIIFSIIILSGCTTYRRTLESARSRAAEFEQINGEWAIRNSELEQLNIAERKRINELRKINNIYIESERKRTEAERLIVDSLSGIFKKGSDIIEGLLKSYKIIREYFEAQESLE